MPHHDSNGPQAIAQRLHRASQLWQARRKGAVGRSTSAAPVALPAGCPPDGPRSTLDATIRREQTTGYARLVWGAGEPHLVRADLGLDPGADRAAARRSLVYFAQHTDTHVCDAQSPSRLEPGKCFSWFNPGADGGHRPQEVCTAQVLDQMVRATNAARTSPVTGADMAVCVQTGDNTDNRTTAETRWFLDVLAGRTVAADTGVPGRYEGIQRSGVRWSYQPDGSGADMYRRSGYPALPGFLDAAVAPFEPTGLEVPWLAVMGNHDAVFLGTFGPLSGLRFDRYAELLIGAARKPTGVVGMLLALAHATFVGIDPGRWDSGRRIPDSHHVTPDRHNRHPLDLRGYLGAFLDDGDEPGPAGHGFTEANRAGGTAWWSRPQGDGIQLIGLDTCNHTRGSEGVLAGVQLRWLEEELARHHRRWQRADGTWVEGDGDDRLCILFSHHNSWTMTNRSADDLFPGPRHAGGEVLELLHRFPNVVLWVNGHSHEHRVVAHPRPAQGTADGSGFWEVNTASCIDFGQQARTIEVCDNGDGTLSIFTTVLDHAAPPSIDVPPVGGWTSEALSSVSRERAANDSFWLDPECMLGTPADRNTELLVRAPFGG